MVNRTPGRLSNRPDVVRILAKDDNTLVEIKGDQDQTFTLSSGQFQELNTFGALSTRSDKVVLVCIYPCLINLIITS